MVEQALGIPISWPEPVKYGFHFERYAQVEFRPRMCAEGVDRDLVINVCDIHDKLNIIAEVVRHDTAEDHVLCDVVPRYIKHLKAMLGLVQNVPRMTHV